jgi:hypothetical protein
MQCASLFLNLRMKGHIMTQKNVKIKKELTPAQIQLNELRSAIKMQREKLKTVNAIRKEAKSIYNFQLQEIK